MTWTGSVQNTIRFVTHYHITFCIPKRPALWDTKINSTFSIVWVCLCGEKGGINLWWCSGLVGHVNIRFLLLSNFKWFPEILLWKVFKNICIPTNSNEDFLMKEKYSVLAIFSRYKLNNEHQIWVGGLLEVTDWVWIENKRWWGDI